MLVVVVAVALAAVAPAPAAAGRERRTAARAAEQRRLTFDVMDADVRNVIRLIADAAGKNVVIADDVSGKVTLKLRSVEWRAALNIVVKANRAAVVEEDEILWVAPAERVAALEQAELDRAAAQTLRGPLVTRVIQVNNAVAKDLAKVVEGTLSPRGSVTVDERTNVLIVRDVESSFALRAKF